MDNIYFEFQLFYLYYARAFVALWRKKSSRDIIASQDISFRLLEFQSLSKAKVDILASYHKFWISGQFKMQRLLVLVIKIGLASNAAQTIWNMNYTAQ